MDWARIERDLGRLSEAAENTKQDTSDLKVQIGKLAESVDALRLSVNGLQQTVNSTSTQLVTLNAEKCGERLNAQELRIAALEDVVSGYKKLLGDGAWFLVRIIGSLVVAALAGGIGSKALEWIGGMLQHH